MDTIKIRLTADVEVKASATTQESVVNHSMYSDLVKSKFPDADVRTQFIGVIGECSAAIFKDALQHRLPPSYGEGISATVAYNELVKMPPPAAATPHVVQIGDRFKP